MKTFIFFLLLAFNFSCFSQVTQSVLDEDLALYEIGVGAIYVNMPDYPGSSRNRNIYLPIPSFIYRGEVLRADEDGGVRSRFLFSDDLELNLSIGGSLPSNSEDNPTREGMPDLETLLELGPGLLWHLKRPSKNSPWKFALNIPLRLAASVDFFKAKERGLVFQPMFYAIYDGFLFKNSTWFLSLSTLFASKKYQSYFYDVPEQFVKVERPVYSSSSGYMQSSLSLGMAYRFSKNWSMFSGVLHTRYEESKNINSPLHVRNSNTSFALGILWWFYKSEKRGSLK